MANRGKVALSEWFLGSHPELERGGLAATLTEPAKCSFTERV